MLTLTDNCYELWPPKLCATRRARREHAGCKTYRALDLTNNGLGRLAAQAVHHQARQVASLQGANSTGP